MHRPTSRLARAARRIAPLALVAVSLAACSGEVPDGWKASTTATGPSGSGGTTSTTSSAAPTTGTSPSTASGKIMEGRRAFAREAGLSFEVPERWYAFDLDVLAKMDVDDMPAEIKQMAVNAGIPPEEFFTRMSKQMDIMVMGPPKSGFAPSVNVIPTPLAELPDAAAVRQEFETAGLTVERVEERTADIGPVIVTISSMKVGSRQLSSESVLVQHDGHVTNLTLTTLTKAEGASLLALVLSSLHAE